MNEPLYSAIEFGPNVGMNIKAINILFPNISFDGVEVNTSAAEKLKRISCVKNVFNTSIQEFHRNELNKKYDFVLIKGVLIHINPDSLDDVYDALYSTTGKYLCVAEYYNPVPVEVNYRGYSNRLFKRDFAGEIMKKYPDLELIDYGFTYHGDKLFPQDDVTWFLMKKK